MSRLIAFIVELWRVFVHGELTLLDPSSEKFDFGDSARKSRKESQ